MVSELKDNKHKELKRIAKQWNEQNESTNKWIQIIKSNHILQMKTTMTEMKNSLAGINSGCEQAEEERISKLKDRIIEIIQSKVQGKKEWKKKKMNRARRMCEIPRVPVHASYKEKRTGENILRKTRWKLPKYDEDKHAPSKKLDKLQLRQTQKYPRRDT